MFIASSVSLTDAYAALKRQGVATKQYMLQQASAMSQAPTTSAYTPKSVIQHLVQVIGLMDGWAGTLGVLAAADLTMWIKTQEPTAPANYDPIAEYNAMRAAMVAARDQLLGMFPKDAQGRLLYETFDANNNVVPVSFTVAQLAPVVALCNNVAATIG